MLSRIVILVVAAVLAFLLWPAESPSAGEAVIRIAAFLGAVGLTVLAVFGVARWLQSSE